MLATAAATACLTSMASTNSFSGNTGLLLATFIGWLAIFGRLVIKMKMIGAFVAPLATLILLIQFFVAPVGTNVPKDVNSESLMTIHISLSVLGMAFGIIACVLSVLFLWQQNLLKKKLLDQIPKNLPAITSLDTQLVKTLWAGFVFITLGLLSGAIYTQMYTPRVEMELEFKVLWAILVWVWYLAILLAKNIFNKPGKRIAQMSLAGFCLMALTYFGMGV
jgi:ABC-type uncharacterized transport system permease subunit